MQRIFQNGYRAKCKHRGIQRLSYKRIRAITTLIKSRINNINNKNNNNSPSLSFPFDFIEKWCLLFSIVWDTDHQ